MQVGRNEPCPCGSGRKFKKCCLPQMEAQRAERMYPMDEQRKLKNEFRDEVKKEGKSPVEIETEKVGEDEMMRRDQYVAMRQLQVEREVRYEDIAYTQAAIAKYERFLDEVADLPLSSAREGIAAVINKQIESLIKQLSASTFPRISEVMLAVLEEKFAGPKVEDGDVADAPAEEAVDLDDDDTSEELRDEEPIGQPKPTSAG